MIIELLGAFAAGLIVFGFFVGLIGLTFLILGDR